MSTPKHTPGPWVVHTFTISGKEKLEVLDATGTNACVQANAHLIAAAPAMYEALKGMVSMYDSLNKSNKHDGACPCYHCQARATLAQAEGAHHE